MKILLESFPVVIYEFTKSAHLVMAAKKNYKGRSPNVQRYLDSCGRDIDISEMIASNLAAGARLAAKNESQALDEKTTRTYELQLITLEEFAKKNGDDVVLFSPNKRPFLAATLQTFMCKCSVLLNF